MRRLPLYSRPTVRTACGCCPDTVVVDSSLAAQLTFRLQPRLHLDELIFIEKELQQLVQEQTTATCKSVEATLTALHVVIIRARTPTTDAGACCPHRVRQPRARCC